MANKIFSHAFSALLALSAITANVHGQTLADLIKDTEIREGCIISLAVTDAGGNTLAEWNAGYPMVPASTMKTVTTGLALQELGSGFRFRTSIAYSGYTDSLGTLHGDLYIIGGDRFDCRFHNRGCRILSRRNGSGLLGMGRFGDLLRSGGIRPLVP